MSEREKNTHESLINIHDTHYAYSCFGPIENFTSTKHTIVIYNCKKEREKYLVKKENYCAQQRDKRNTLLYAKSSQCE